MLPLLALQADPIHLPAALRIFEEVRLVAEEDAGRLWGRSLAGPTLLVDPQSRFVVGNEAAGPLTAREGVYVGRLPQEIPMANTAIDWAGKKWSLVMWPELQTDRVSRTQILLHEAWHREQEALGLAGTMLRNEHLDTPDGRAFLRVELRALAKALEEDTVEAARDALAIRAERQGRFPAARSEEDRMEIHEGLAEYTGVKLRGTGDEETRRALARTLRQVDPKKSFPMSFAYLTGPAYGLLLDRHGADWRPGLSIRSSLVDMLRRKVRNVSPRGERVAEKYGLRQVRREEAERERARRKVEFDFRRRLVDGPLLELPLGKFQFSFDPNATLPLGDLGTVYPIATIVGPWGRLEVNRGARITPDFQRVYVPAPNEAFASKGDGWTLELKDGWRLEPRPQGGWRAVKA